MIINISLYFNFKIDSLCKTLFFEKNNVHKKTISLQYLFLLKHHLYLQTATLNEFSGFLQLIYIILGNNVK